MKLIVEDDDVMYTGLEPGEYEYRATSCEQELVHDWRPRSAGELGPQSDFLRRLVTLTGELRKVNKAERYLAQQAVAMKGLVMTVPNNGTKLRDVYYQNGIPLGRVIKVHDDGNVDVALPSFGGVSVEEWRVPVDRGEARKDWCPECKGTKQVPLFNSVSPCSRCCP